MPASPGSIRWAIPSPRTASSRSRRSRSSRPRTELAFRVAVLASGTGTNLQAILDQLHGRDGIEVVAVASDKPGAQALERAGSAGVETEVFANGEFDDRPSRDAAVADWLEQRQIDLVVLAGYMQLLSPAFIARFPNRIVNV